MPSIDIKSVSLTISFDTNFLKKLSTFFIKNALFIVALILVGISIYSYIFFYDSGLALAYNDARSHLNIGRRVVEGLKPGLAQLGSVWLPLPHALMIPFVWNDFLWHSGLAGAIVSMVSYVGTGLLVYKFLKNLGIGYLGRLTGVFVFAFNLNILYLQSTAMTELLLLFTMTAGVYELVMWHVSDKIFRLIKAAFWIALSTLVRYDGWFLLIWASVLIVYHVFKKKGYKASEGTLIFFGTLAAFGTALWFLWNLAIFKDPLYFAFGPYSAHAQQKQLLEAGNLATKGNLWLSIKMYLYALVYNTGALPLILGAIGAVLFFLNDKVKESVKLGSTALMAPLVFNILALYLGFSVLFIQGISGNTWFNVRYGVMLAPTVAIFIGYLVGKLKDFRPVIIGLLFFVTFFAFANVDAVTIDDARVGSSQKNVSEVAGWLNEHAKNEKGFVLISAASHDAIIFSSGLPMKRFIHEGTGAYWDSATTGPEHWARWIVMRTYDENDQTYKLTKNTVGFKNDYDKVQSFPFADIYEIKPEYLGQLNYEPIFGKQK